MDLNVQKCGHYFTYPYFQAKNHDKNGLKKTTNSRLYTMFENIKNVSFLNAFESYNLFTARILRNP